MNTSRCWCLLGSAGELLNQIEPATGKNNQYTQVKGEVDHTFQSREGAAKDADELFIHRWRSFLISIFLFRGLLDLSFY
jgi:hypothetical protein